MSIQNKVCVGCYRPIEKARIDLLGLSTALCAKCAHTRSILRTTPVVGNISICAHNQVVKNPPQDGRILRTVIWDGFPRQVTVASSYVMEDIYLEIIADGEIWAKSILLV